MANKNGLQYGNCVTCLKLIERISSRIQKIEEQIKNLNQLDLAKKQHLTIVIQEFQSILGDKKDAS
jgi:hypothetical protein